MATKITPEIDTDNVTDNIEDPTDYKNTKAMMIFLEERLIKLSSKKTAAKKAKDEQDFSQLFKIVSIKHKFKTDAVLLILITRVIAFYCTENRKKLTNQRKDLLMKFMMCIHKVLDDRTWMSFNDDGEFSNYMRYSTILKTQPRRLARYLAEALKHGIMRAPD